MKQDLFLSGFNTGNGALVPIGTVINFMGNIPPDGYLFCDGSEYKQEDYPEFVKFLTEQFGDPQYFGGGGERIICSPRPQRRIS